MSLYPTSQLCVRNCLGTTYYYVTLACMHLDEDVICLATTLFRQCGGGCDSCYLFPARRVNQFLKYCYFIEEDMMLKKLRPRFLMMTFSIFSVLVLILSACCATVTPHQSGN